MFSAIRATHRDKSGQATIEAAFAIPILMVLLLLILQPGIVLYDYIVMQGAASEGCRLIATSGGMTDENEDYIRRRLSAIPQVDIFHVHSGGCSYQIEADGSETSNSVTVTISNEISPLPLVDILLSPFNGGENIKVEAKCTLATQPDWVLGSVGGKSPSEWVHTLENKGKDS